MPSLGSLEAHPQAVEQWETVYAKARDDGYPESRAAQIAWGAVQRSGWYQDDDGLWHHGEQNPHPIASPEVAVLELAAVVADLPEGTSEERQAKARGWAALQFLTGYSCGCDVDEVEQLVGRDVGE